MELYLLIVLPVFASLLLYLIPGRVTVWLGSFVYLGVFGVTVHLFWRVRFLGDVISTAGENSLGIQLYCDLTAAVFLVLASFLFLCLFLYTHMQERVDKMFSFLMTVLEGLVILIFLSQDLFNLYVAVEVAAVVCSILIMFKRESRSIYDGMIYLLTNITGMLFFLLGIGLLYRQTGVLNLGDLKTAVTALNSSQLRLPFAMIMTGTCMKCALIPAHFWLPAAHGTPGAPTAVSAVLSGVYIKSGVYLFIRMKDMFEPAVSADTFFMWLGIVTALAGIVMAVCQNDIKLILAYHTISQIGLIIAGLCADSSYVQAGAMLHILNHALFKSLLFLAAGFLIHKYHTRNVYEIRGVLRRFPVTGMAVAAGILGITGAPLFNGSISKYLLAKGTDGLTDAFFLLINFGTILSFVKFGRMLWTDHKQETQTMVAEARQHADPVLPGDWFASAILCLLSLLCLATGIFARPFIWLLFGTQLEIDPAGYVMKAVVWALSFAGADLFYRNIISRSKRIKAGIDFSVSFNTVIVFLCLSFGVIFAAGVWGV